MERLVLQLSLAFFLFVLSAAHGEDQPQDSNDAFPKSFPAVDKLPEIRELPNPFVFQDGTTVKNRDDWALSRRAMLRSTSPSSAMVT